MQKIRFTTEIDLPKKADAFKVLSKVRGLRGIVTANLITLYQLYIKFDARHTDLEAILKATGGTLTKQSKANKTRTYAL